MVDRGQRDTRITRREFLQRRVQFRQQLICYLTTVGREVDFKQARRAQAVLPVEQGLVETLCAKATGTDYRAGSDG